MYSPQQTAFAPRSLVSTIQVTATASAGVKVEWQAYSGSNAAADYRFYNDGNSPVVIGYGATATEAQTNATGSANGKKCVIVAPSGIEILKFGEQTFFSASTTGNTCNLHIIGGQGI